eukprot:602783-Pleurochrysis_carterae.AAC.1
MIWLGWSMHEAGQVMGCVNAVNAGVADSGFTGGWMDGECLCVDSALCARWTPVSHVELKCGRTRSRTV